VPSFFRESSGSLGRPSTASISSQEHTRYAVPGRLETLVAVVGQGQSSTRWRRPHNSSKGTALLVNEVTPASQR
jgi:hypothetical protein